MASTTQEQVIRFIWKNIICRYGLPLILVSDNCSQFIGERVKEFVVSHGIKHKTSSVKHAETNGQVEVTNRFLIGALKTRLLQYGRSWVDELPSVLLAYRTTERTPTGETSFILTYGAEALLPVEMMMKTTWLLSYQDGVNNQSLASEKDLAEEVHEATVI